MDSSANPAFGTPTLTVLSNRGALVRTLTYNRQMANAALDERIERTVYSPAGFVASRIDARLFSASGTPNFSYVPSLTGRVLRTDSVDAGVTVTLVDVDGRPSWAHDARGTTTEWNYDPLGRPLSAKEANGSATFETRDRWKYGEGEPNAQAHNLRGQCVCRYDTAGRLTSSGFTLNGQPLDQTRRLLANPEAAPNWKGDDEAAWAAALDTTAYPTAWTYGATDAWLTQTDAKGNVQTRAFDVAGRLKDCGLRLVGGARQSVLAAINYSAAGQVLSETAGNGVITRCEYEPETQRLVRLSATRPAQAGRATVLQELHYTYDPVGNILSVRDNAQATTYWRNQKVEPTRIYTYDALYQLMSATGREMVNRGQQGSELPKPIIPLPTDDSVYTNYTRAYAYDRGGNLTRIQHRGAVNYAQEIVVSNRSNHALKQNAAGAITSASVDDGAWFDQSGNQRMLLPDRLQPLSWNDRNRLAGVTLVPRNGLHDDRETYQYGADGMRVRKQTTLQTSGTIRTSEAIYLPGLTLRVTRSGDESTLKVVEALHEIRLDNGRASARALHWETGLPPTMKNDALRFGHGDLIGSTGLELDDDADLISWEEYYPYGGTAVWTTRSQAEADTKFVRYSGKERDATGLYDYGWRSYQPWLGRWLNPDPVGSVDGLNLYRMVRNNPPSFQDPDGKMPFRKCFGMKSKSRDAEEMPYVPSSMNQMQSEPGSSAAGSSVTRSITHNILDRLVGVIESGRAGTRALTGKRFEETMEKLSSLYIDLQDGGALPGGASVLEKSSGFRSPPKDLIDQNRDKKSTNMLQFLKPYLERDVDSENFCIQNLISDLSKWTRTSIEKQEGKIGNEEARLLIDRISAAENIEVDAAAFSKNPASRAPETQEEVLQYLYFSVSLFQDESSWLEYGRAMYEDDYPNIKAISYSRAKNVYEKNKLKGVYES
ncbi:RHS repeat-associated core domain-containing protein [Burkholderia ubonensis]|uniref:RHS repeat-associated core domain-containing protein n=1 Tax=Burkholderia ubonensis TaxID=101571 RepID=UPI00075ABF24|nr:RHS repeat-associated core domain-containing protein [Burkholderia ubonensis]AOI68876.1 hypothetical protein WI31_04530 [Burkholderia ubonensis]KUZ15888.1 hypothetical protein WI29_18860 [Burkholderia ubonensis]KUZ24597.1 hypothetical protein WI30_29235 [Burkholderia ubonensis]KUZ38425.1 hypothetical protein WI32_12260 [Burkholderia ubonensis]KUZ46213.1 hypothetical protein WI33_24760 [Burkholderia ubonensis]